jgi:hypothetical protein
VKAIYDNRIYNVAEEDIDLVLEGSNGSRFTVEFSDDQLVLDPTDSEVADADNLAEWYGLVGWGA